MAATNNLWSWKKSNGAPYTMSTYNAANAAVGTYLPIAITGIAGANSPTFVKLSDNIEIGQMPCKAATGTIAIEVDGKEQAQIDYAQNQESNQARPYLGLRVAAGSILAFRVSGVLPA